MDTEHRPGLLHVTPADVEQRQLDAQEQLENAWWRNPETGEDDDDSDNEERDGGDQGAPPGP